MRYLFLSLILAFSTPIFASEGPEPPPAKQRYFHVFDQDGKIVVTFDAEKNKAETSLSKDDLALRLTSTVQRLDQCIAYAKRLEEKQPSKKTENKKPNKAIVVP